jgi:hypothetical protein
MITYEWVITALDCVISEDGLTNVVLNVHWRYKGTNENGVTADVYGIEIMPQPNQENFTPYEDLDLTIVSGWLEDKFNMEQMKTSVAHEINLIVNPIIVTLPLPNQTI